LNSTGLSVANPELSPAQRISTLPKINDDLAPLVYIRYRDF
jgi:hypothetical protein